MERPFSGPCLAGTITLVADSVFAYKKYKDFRSDSTHQAQYLGHGSNHGYNMQQSASVSTASSSSSMSGMFLEPMDMFVLPGMVS
jgi:hypothetical protein